MDVQKTARALGVLSVGLGVAEIAAPRAVARLTGAEPRVGLLRSFGLREIVAGVGLLATEAPAPWLWFRTAGDALDLAALAHDAARTSGSRQRQLFASIVAVAGVAVLDALAARRASAQ